MLIEDKKINIIEKFVNFVPVALGFLMPAFFLPTTTEFFELNKLALLLICTILLVLTWALRIALGEKIEVAKSSIDATLIIYTVIFSLATIFSVNKSLSVFGSQGRWFPSLIAVVTMVFYFYCATALMKTEKTSRLAILSLVAGSSISSLVAILGYFGIHFGSAPFLNTDSFNLAGSLTTTAVLAGLGFTIGNALLKTEEKNSVKIPLAIITVINFFFVALVNVLAGWAVVISGVLFNLYLGRKNANSKDKTIAFSIAGAIAAILLVIYLPTTAEIIKNPSYPSEITLPVKESWIISSSTIQNYPILATGPSTFQLNFSRFRPLSLNTGDMWNIRFDKPYNEVFNTISSIGIVGLIAAAFLTMQVIKLALSTRKLNDETGVLNIASIGVLSLLPIFLFTYATVLNVFLIIYLTTIIVARHSMLKNQTTQAELVAVNFTSITSVSTIGAASAIKGNYINYVMAIPFLGISAYAGYLFFRGYAADTYMRKAVVATLDNNGSKVYEYQQKAINLMPNRDNYHSAFARTNIALANSIASNENLSDTDKANIQNLISQSIRTTRIATEVVNPKSVASWETRAVIYRSLINVADNADEWAINAYNTAIQLDPSNPALRLDLGGIYFNKKDYLTAGNLFRQATALKPNYANAHYNFAQALIQLNDTKNAIAELEVTKVLVEKDSEDYNKVASEVEKLKNLPNVAGASDTKTTVEDLAKDKLTDPKDTTQEPLTNAAEKDQINNANLKPSVLPSETEGTKESTPSKN